MILVHYDDHENVVLKLLFNADQGEVYLNPDKA